MRHELFEVGSYDYSDLDDRLDKPVEWTEDDLKLIAENYRGGIPLTSEHDNIYVGIGNEIIYEEGKLFIEIPDELDMEGKGLSPKIDVLLKDNGDSFGIDTMSLIDVGVTKSPRKIRLLNSDIAGETGATGNPNPEPPAPQPQPQPPAKDTNVATTLLLEKLQDKDAEIGNDGSTPGGRNPQNSGDVIETGSTGSTGDEDKPSFTTREEYNKILKDMGFNRTRI